MDDCKYDTGPAFCEGLDGFKYEPGEDDGNDCARALVTLRRFPTKISSRGGVLIGDLRGNEALAGAFKVSSSFRKLDLFPGVPFIATA